MSKSNKKVNGVSQLMNDLMVVNGYSGNQTQEWKEVDDLYYSIGSFIIATMSELKNSAELFALEHELVSKETILTVNGLNSDLNAFSEDLVKIKNRHSNKSGIINPETDDMVLCLSVYNDYVILNDRLRAVVFPSMLTVTEALADISEHIRKRDPAVITDVEVKETKEQSTAVNQNEPSLEDDKDKVNV